MSYGTKMTLPLTAGNFIASVLTHPDFVNKGYVWGENASVHYCFMDPDKVRFDVWEKTFHWKALAALLLNLAGLGVALFFGNVPLAIKLFLCIPSMPLMLLYHYRMSAKAQVAAVVTNGPQMQYPFGLTTAGMVAGGTTILAIGAVVTGLLLKTKGAIPGITLGPVSLSSGFVTAVMAIGGGVNIAAIALFVLGTLTVPFGWVLSPSVPVTDKRGALGGWYHFGRTTGTSFSSYRIAVGNPVGLTYACGGLIPIIINRIITGFVGALSAGSGSPLPAQLVIWGLLPLTPEGKPLYDENYEGTYEELPPNENARGLIFVVGAESFPAPIAVALRRLGVTQAVATDGHLSPLLGTHGDLLIDTYFALDPIQKYGLMAIPE